MAPANPQSDSPLRAGLMLTGLGVLMVALAAFRVAVGSAGIGWPGDELAGLILETRLNRMWIGVVVGAGLAVSGVALQTLLRNPLAEPYILGLSTGAGAGVMAQAWVLYTLGFTIGPGYLGAAVGAALSMIVVFAAGRRRGVIDPIGLLLTGVVLGTINGALIMLFNYAAGPGGLRDDLARWMMGYINEGIGPRTLWSVGVLTAVGIALLAIQARAMDVATLSEGEAVSLGVNVSRMRTLLFVVASVLAAGAVVLSGPVAFVGLICPHLARLLLGPRHAALLAGSAFLGASLILAADTASSLIAWAFDFGMIPIGVFTAMLGGPAFLWMLRPQLGRGIE